MYKFKQINFVKIIFTFLYDYIFLISKAQPKSSTILIIRVDAIGDYILFRNFLQEIRDFYKKEKIVFCGNVICKDFAEAFDSSVINRFIWVDKPKFKKERNYRNQILLEIKSVNAEVAIETTFSREWNVGDALIRASKATCKIGKRGDSNNTALFWKYFSDLSYTNLIPNPKNILFEFNSNKLFFETIFKREIEITKSSLPIISEKENTITIFPGASEPNKVWDSNNFVFVIKNILEKNIYEVELLGSKSDEKYVNSILNQINDPKLKNNCGKTNLVELARRIAASQLLISNDSVAVHIAAAVGTPCVCVIDGRHFGRFAPYPPEYKGMYFVYPNSELENRSLYWLNTEKYKYLSPFPVNSITPQKVLEFVFKALDN